MTNNRVILIVLDGFGVGELPDADRYGDCGSNTLKGVAAAAGNISLPNLEKLGLGNLGSFKSIKSGAASGAYGRCGELSQGKDSSVGHWEIAGVVTKDACPTYPDGFPPEITRMFKRLTGRGMICNKAGSGTDFIDMYGVEHMETGLPIVYTSADSVFQVAAHEKIVPLEELYRICDIVRNQIMVPPDAVLRVIARPFMGEPGNFTRTEARKDYSLPPGDKTLLDLLKGAGLETWGIGKIDELFVFKGLTRSFHTRNNKASLDKLFECMKEDFDGLVFVNLIDFDMLYGHRNDPAGYAAALECFDKRLAHICAELRSSDTLIITSDHGNDPTTPSTDHSREFTPLLVHGAQVRKNHNLRERDSFADIAQTIAEILELDASGLAGAGFWREIRLRK